MRVDFEWCAAGHCMHPECVTIAGGKLSAVPFPSGFGKIRHPTEGWILFDTGYSTHFHEATRPFPERLYAWVTPVTLDPHESAVEQLRRVGIKPEEVRWIVISHFHGDHVAGLKDFPNANFLCTEAAYRLLTTRSRLKNVSQGYLANLLPETFMKRVRFVEKSPVVTAPPAFSPFTTAYDLFGDRSLLAIPLEGHSPGQIGLVMKSENDREIFLVADAVWHSETIRSLRLPHPITNLIGSQKDQYLRTVKRLHELQLRDNGVLIIPSHCREIKVGAL